MYAVGIDVSKSKSTIAIIKDGEIFVKPFNIDHTIEGFQIFLDKIKNVKKSEVKVVMESTGIYHLPILFKLLDSNFFVCVENAFLLKKYFDVYLRKTKSDKLDSIKIAKYCFEKWNSLTQFSLQDEHYQDLLFLSRQYDQFMSLKTKAKVQLANLIDVIFPSFTDCFNEDLNQFLFMLDLLEKFYHPSLISNLSENDFFNEVDKIAQKRGLHTSARISSYLYSLSQNILSARPLNLSTKLTITTCIDTIRELEKATNNILAQMNEIASTLPEFDTVKSMVGVGQKTCSRLIAEIGDVRRFKNANSLIAYAGIDTPTYQSGNFYATERHITKRR